MYIVYIDDYRARFGRASEDSERGKNEGADLYAARHTKPTDVPLALYAPSSRIFIDC